MAFDFDGVLCDSLHRYKLDETGQNIDLAHWRRNSTPAMIAKDSPIPEQIAIYNKALADENTVVIITTARVFCPASLAWLEKHTDGQPDYINSRQGETDTRRGHELKGAFVAAFRQTFKALKTVLYYEDNLSYIKGFKLANPDALIFYVKSEQGH